MKNRFFLPLLVVVSIFFSACQDNLSEISEEMPSKNQQVDKQAVTLIINDGDEVAQSLSNVTQGQIEFNRTDNLPDFSSYEYLVSTPTELAPSGFLRKIIEIKEQKSKVIVKTVPAQVNELVGNVQHSEKSYFVAENPEKYRNLTTRRGHKVQYTVQRRADWEHEFAEFRIDLDELWDIDQDPSTTYDQVRIFGNLIVQPSLEVGIDISWFRIREFETVLNTSASTSLNLDWRYNLPINFNYEIANIDLPPTTINLGWLPVVINHNLVVLLDVNGNVNARINSSFAGSIETELGVGYKKKKWELISRVNNMNINFNPLTANANFNLNARLSERFESSIYEFARIGLRSSQNLGAQGSLSTGIGVPTVLNWNADLNVNAGAFAEFMFDIPNFDNSWDRDLWSGYYNLGQGTIVINN